MLEIHKARVPFNIATVAFSLVLVVSLTATFLVTIFNKFDDMATNDARAVFSQVMERTAQSFLSVIEGSKQAISVESGLNSNFFSVNESLEGGPLQERLLQYLKSQPEVYSYYIGMKNGDFLQVLSSSGNQKINAAIGAPSEMYIAIRKIRSDANSDSRKETWWFFDRDDRPIGTKTAEAKYDPRVRPWYRSALPNESLIATDPYSFSSSGNLGVTLAKALPNKSGVVGVDLDLDSLDAILFSLRATEKSVVALIDSKNRLVAIGANLESDGKTQRRQLLTPKEVSDPVLRSVLERAATFGINRPSIAEVNDEEYVVARKVVTIEKSVAFQILAYAPMSEFTAQVFEIRNVMVVVAGLALVLSVSLTWFISKGLSVSLGELSGDAERIKKFDFSETGQIRSVFKEIDNLGQAQRLMKSSIRRYTDDLKLTQLNLEFLIKSGLEMTTEKDRLVLMRRILFAGKELVNCDAGTIYEVTGQNTLLFRVRTKDDDLPSVEIPLTDPETGAPNHRHVSAHVALTGESVMIDDIYTETRFDLQGTREYDKETGYRSISMLTIPLAPRDGEVIGVVQFINALDRETGEITSFSADAIRFVESLAAQAAVALDNHNLVASQKDLMDSMIRLIAVAVDTKSPYTGGHCERVPELARMLAEEACAVRDGPLASFNIETEDEWREFKIGAWLHDCGKVTTPEYVVDKATKLETIYNRIHEIRTRFEVILRDTEIDKLQSELCGEDAAAAKQRYEERKRQLFEEFAFVAECNIGGEFMDSARIERLHSIAKQNWVRNFDDRLGLGMPEAERLKDCPAPPLPVEEALLSDMPSHIIPRKGNSALDLEHGFKMTVPKNMYNNGELQNLSIARGTLTEEERFKINEHVTQTIIMLEQLPFPKNLSRVPEYAGTHHEAMAGTGYPRKLTENELSVPARIMAIADIFEALTASDRPYKKTKTLSESVRILSFFKKDKHIDPNLFDLLLRSGVYKRYAENYLLPEQVDEVEIDQYLN